jgi:ribA/ribD-fused uncharacterized protein
MSDVIDSFTGEYRFLSNFWPVKVEIEGIVYPSVEHAYVAMKTTDIELREKISTIVSPVDVKRFGRKINIRPDWDTIKFGIMDILVNRKFFCNDDLKQKLINTFPKTLIEGNTWGDTYWGVCRGVGENWLGRILMVTRDKLIYFSNIEKD